ncbi:MAG TPA: ATP-binding protein, partial [Vicinamibacteria bacterium]|nr:ATP-binding protein [Vicinamibacteria bacterium]
LRSSVAAALAIAFTVTALLAAILSAPLAGPLREIMDAARRFAAGDLGARSRVRREDEIGELARILNRSADQLQGRLLELGRERARIEAILSSMEEGVLAVDHEGTVLLVNDPLREVLGSGDPVGRHYLEALRHGDLADAVDEVLRTGLRRETEIAIARAHRVYAVLAAPFPGAEGSRHGAVITFHDVTERRRLDQVRRDFVANASHELRTPLTSIRGFVEALEDGAVDDPATAQRFLAKIRAHADRMAALVADLLELSRLESGESAPRRDRVDPAAVASEVAGSLADLAAGREVTLRVEAKGAPAVPTDADRLRRILENLVENAVKYTPPGGHVTVATRAGPDRGAEVEVKDDGPGIAAEHLPRIFERFYRVDKARSRELGGTGLGLSIVRHLAESIGARVSVQSRMGAGSTFTVFLPARPADAPDAPRPSSPRDSIDGGH